MPRAAKKQAEEGSEPPGALLLRARRMPGMPGPAARQPPMRMPVCRRLAHRRTPPTAALPLPPAAAAPAEAVAPAADAPDADKQKKKRNNNPGIRVQVRAVVAWLSPARDSECSAVDGT